MSTEKLELAASMLALNLLRSEDLAGVAGAALEEGCDSPSLRVLAGLTPAEVDEARALFDRTLSELDVAAPSGRDAVLRLARETAKDIISGAVSAYDGARQIWNLTLRVPDRDLRELDSFVYAASEWQGRLKDRRVFEEGIAAAAKELAGT